MKNWILSTSRKRVEFIWTYSGWFNYTSWLFILVAAAFFIVPISVRFPLIVVLAFLSILLVVDVLAVFAIDRRARCRGQRQ